MAYIEQQGDDDPDEPPSRQPYARDVHDHVDQGSKREEDDAQQRQDERVECRFHEGRSGDPEDQQREPREKASKQREQTTHPRYLLSGLALSTTSALRCAGRRFAPALHYALEHKPQHGGGSSPRDAYPLG